MLTSGVLVRVSARLRRLLPLGARGANVALITALAAVPMIGMVGLATDYGVAIADKARLDGAADAAALVGIETAQSTLLGGGTTSSAIAAAQTQAAAAFKANAQTLILAAIPQPIISVTRTNQTITSTVNYNASTTTMLAKVLGIRSIPFSGASASNLSLATYINYYVIVDISQSMGIGATATDMQNLFNRVVAYKNGTNGETGCVFGCHVTGPGQKYTNEYLAHGISPAITLRVDAAIQAIQSIIAQAQSSATSSNNIQIGIYTMSDDPVTHQTLNTIAAPSSNYPQLTQAAATIDLGNNTSAGIGDTSFVLSLANFASILPAQGDGSSVTKPLNYVFIITDGAQDVAGNCPAGHCVTAFNPSNCNSIKNNASMGVIYTTYLPIYANNDPSKGLEGNYANLVAPIVGRIPTNLEACASSPSLYYEATDGPGIVSELQQLFASTAAQATIIQ